MLMNASATWDDFCKLQKRFLCRVEAEDRNVITDRNGDFTCGVEGVTFFDGFVL